MPDSSLDAALTEARRLAAARRRYSCGVWLAQALLLLIFLALWQFGGGPLFDPFFFGSPRGVAAVLAKDFADPQFYRDLSTTSIEMALGYGTGSALGIATGALLARWRFVADVLDPVFVALNSIPRIALAPLLVIWFGIDLGSKVVLAATLVFFLMFFSTLSGIRQVDGALISVARVMGANDRQMFFKVQLPGALPWIMSGLRLGLPFALIGVIVGEFLAASSGVGYRLNMYSTSYNTNGTFAMLTVLMVAMMILNATLGWVERRAAQIVGIAARDTSDQIT